jgi:hypothetical protein
VHVALSGRDDRFVQNNMFYANARGDISNVGDWIDGSTTKVTTQSSSCRRVAFTNTTATQRLPIASSARDQAD